jgi:hypothetical protein
MKGRAPMMIAALLEALAIGHPRSAVRLFGSSAVPKKGAE